MFSTPIGFPSHLNPGTPGCIHEGGELGYALATAFGAAFDNPDLLAACIVGDGEAESGPTATAWHCAKYLNPARDGAVLPLLHLNHYKISSVTIFGAMTDEELRDLFRGYGYAVKIVEAWGDTVDERAAAHRRTAAALDDAYGAIGIIQQAARNGEIISRPRWPMLILRSPKGWTCPKQVDGKPLEGSFRSHQVPIEKPQTNPEHLALLEQWLRSYGPEELFDAEGRPRAQLLQTIPTGDLRIGMNAHAYGGRLRRELSLPDFRAFRAEVKERGAKRERDMAKLGEYLREVVRRNATNFRIFCPGEMESNRLDAIFEVTDRQFVWPAGPQDDHISRVGRVVEILSECTSQPKAHGDLTAVSDGYGKSDAHLPRFFSVSKKRYRVCGLIRSGKFVAKLFG
jgi:xylulose-5-phosphate/fructose-6-phosphate phosphoketolase